jgi:uncharacterized protein YecT (DUF1311 family)
VKQSVITWATAASVAAAGIGLLAGCSSSASSAASSTPSASTATAASTGASASGGASAGSSASASPTAFAAIVEPFDPGHPAQAKSSPASCGSENTTLAIEQCFENKTETADASIDTVQQAAFNQASTEEQAALNRQDTAWLTARSTVCAKAYNTGGTIDGINVSSCLLDESTAYLDGVKGVTPAEAVLKSTDSTSLSDVSWYTTPEGTRIGMIDTQGDATGGVIIAWVVIAGAANFVVNPAQFTYQDGSFTDAGKIEGASPKGHVVTTGAEYQFSIDYSNLSAAPGPGKTAGWVYTVVKPVAVWR